MSSSTIKKKLVEKKYHFAAIILAVVILAAVGFIKFPHHSANAQSTTNLNWTESPTLPWAMEPPVVFNSKLWIIGGYGGGSPSFNYSTSLYGANNDVWSSSDGTNWTEVDANTPWKARNGVTPVVFNNKLWIIGGNGYNDVWSSSDGATWTEATANAAFPAGAAVAAVAYNGELWIIDSGSGNEIWSSSDGATWTEVSNNGPWPWVFGTRGSGYANNGFFFVLNGKMWATDSDEDPLWYSTDGVNWTEETNGVPLPAESMTTFNNKIWAVAYSNGYGIWSSSDGNTWTEATSNPPYVVADGYLTGFNGKLWIMNGGPEYDKVWSSSDGATWTQAAEIAPWPERYGASTLVFNNEMWVMGGDGVETHSTDTPYYTDVWSSPDGASWTEDAAIAPWPARDGAAALVFNGKMWIMGGSENGTNSDVWSSSDGVNWTRATANAPWPTRDGASAFVFNGKMWIMGGEFSDDTYYNDVWSSSDGVNWSEVTTSAPWSKRAYASALVFNGKMWVMGGFSLASTYPHYISTYNDIWSSSDGVNWTEVTANASWPSGSVGPSTWPFSSSESFAVANNEMWVIDSGGSAWYSSDGVTWTKANTNSLTSGGGTGASVLTFNNELWIMGGTNGSYSSFNDVWSGSIVTPTTCTGPFSFTFTDPTITPGITPIRAVHITELRNDIDSLSADAGLSDYSYADPTITPGVSSIRAVDITDLRTALADVYVACGQSAPTYTDTTLTPGSSLIRAVDITQLRSYVSSAL